MGKVYLLTITKGHEHEEIKLGFFTTLELAEQAKENILKKLVNILNKYSQEQIQEFENALLLSYEEAFYMDDDEEIEYSQELLDYMNWHFRRKSNSFNLKDLKIVEYLMDETLLDLSNLDT